MIKESPSCNQEIVNVDWCYTLKPANEDWHESLLDWEESKAKKSDLEYTILLVIFLERVKSDKDWVAEDNLFLIDSMRQNFVHLLCKHRTKVRKAVSGVLNKLLQNFSKTDQKQELLHRTIGTVSSSIYGMLARSKNQLFQERCMNELAVNSLPETRSVLRANLWAIATERFGVFPSTHTHSQQFNVIKPRKKRSLEYDSHVEAKKQQPDGFDDLAEVVKIVEDLNAEMAQDPPTAVAQPSEPLSYDIQEHLSPFEGVQQRSADKYLDPKMGDDQWLTFLQSLENNAATSSTDNLRNKSQKPSADSWELLNDDALVTSFGDEPYSLEFMLNGSKLINDEQCSDIHGANRSVINDVQKPVSSSAPSWSKPTHVKDHMLPQLPHTEQSSKDMEDWLNEFSCWDS
jgi:hypothetical protein